MLDREAFFTRLCWQEYHCFLVPVSQIVGAAPWDSRFTYLSGPVGELVAGGLA